MKKYRIILILIIALVLSSLLYFVLALIVFDNKAPVLQSVVISNITNDKFDLTVKIKNTLFEEVSCYLTLDENLDLESEGIDFQPTKNNYCTYPALSKNQEYYIYLQDQNGNISEAYPLTDSLSKKYLTITAEDEIYLVNGSSSKLEYTINTVGLLKEEADVSFSSADPSIVKVDDKGNITALKDGTTSVTIRASDGSIATDDNVNINPSEDEQSNNSNNAMVTVHVTSLINTPAIRNNRPFLACNEYSSDEASILDDLLAYRIEQAGGYQTRAAVVAAARFLLLEFPYRLNYFPENGRIDYPGRLHADGEGRYYHVGLYLDESKFADIEASVTGPAIWGCPLEVNSGEVDQPAGNFYANGLDCSGFVSWVLLNGGYDVGDLGAGFTNYADLSDLGEKVSITRDLLSSNTIKAGDLIGYNGHIAMIIGIDDEHIYVGEILYYNVGTTVLTYTRSSLLNSLFTYIIPMDEVYLKDGNYTAMW